MTGARQNDSIRSTAASGTWCERCDRARAAATRVEVSVGRRIIDREVHEVPRRVSWARGTSPRNLAAVAREARSEKATAGTDRAAGLACEHHYRILRVFVWV